jgi:predicted nucleotidyltransferase
LNDSGDRFPAGAACRGARGDQQVGRPADAQSSEVADLAFVTHESHRRLLKEALIEVRRDPEVIGLMLMGSVARGDAFPTSDLDLFLLLSDDVRRDFHVDLREGILVERKYADTRLAKGKLETRPMEVYAYLDSRLLYDPKGRFQELAECARRRFEVYRTPAEEKRYLAHCLRSARVKLRAATDAGDEFRAAYVVGMTTWFALEAVWAVNDRPLPPGGALLAQFAGLPMLPLDFHTWLRRFFAGPAATRVQAMAEIIDWLLPLLASADG